MRVETEMATPEVTGTATTAIMAADHPRGLVGVMAKAMAKAMGTGKISRLS